MKKALLIFSFLFLLQGYNLLAKDVKGAEFRTKQSFLYGRFEVSIKSANREGMLSSFFTYYDGGTGVADWNEIDIEIMGRYDDCIQFNTITPGQVNHVSSFPVPFSPHLDYHTYAFEWTPAYVAWFIDGVEVYRQTGAHITTLNRAQKIMMNVWNPQYPNWAGAWNNYSLPAFAYYDFVKYYTYTPGTGNYGSGNNFTHSWTDEFDYWNTSRWDKGTHTWNGNGADFVRENAVLQNGKLILCLTNATNLGYTDVTSPTLITAKVHANSVIAYFSEELDQSSAASLQNYIITGATVTAAQLQPDQKSVVLSLEGWDFLSGKNLVVQGVRDASGNQISPVSKAIVLQSAFTFPVKINCAGPEAIGYQADREWNLNTEFGYLDGSNGAFSSSLQIGGTEEDEIYRTERHSMIKYQVRLPKGNFNVKLLFAENYFTTGGKRIFDVFLEGQRVINNLDVCASVGPKFALIREIQNVTVTDGILDIGFGAKVDNPFLNGIIIELNYLSVNDPEVPGHSGFLLHQNYPNPFNGQTTVPFSIQDSDYYTLTISNVLGEQLVARQLGYLQQGFHTVALTHADLGTHSPSTGIYFYSLRDSKNVQTRKLLLLN